jgi:endonuclease G
MNEPIVEKPTRGAAPPFRSFGELRRAHETLLADEREADADAPLQPGRREKVEDFLGRALETGRSLVRAAERRRAQGLVDYWVGRLVEDKQAGAERRPDSFLLWRLAPLDAEQARAVAEAAEAEITRLSGSEAARHQADNLAKSMLLSLFQPDEDGPGFEPGPPRPRAELLGIEVSGKGADRELAQEVLDALLRAGVLREDGGIEMVPETAGTLAMLWPRLAGALEDRTQFRQVAEYWQRNNRAAGAVLSSELVDKAGPRANLGKLELEFAEEALRQADRAQRRRAFVVIGALVLAIVASGMAIWANDERKEALEAKAGATRLATLAEEARRDETEARLAAERARDEAQQGADRADRERNEALAAERALSAERALLRPALRTLEDALRRGALQPTDLPRELAAHLLPTPAGSGPGAPPGADDPVAGTRFALLRGAGYSPVFLGPEVPLPTLSPALRERAWEEGRPLNYPNLSIVLDRERRLPIFAASNHDRVLAAWQPLQARPRFAPDPRLPEAVQPLPAWFEAAGMDRGHLAARREVAWSDRRPDDPAAAFEALGGTYGADSFPNLVPQLESFSRGVWAALEDWVLTAHNPEARRLVIFTGPVLSPDDPLRGGAQLPRRFWKVVVSRRGEGQGPGDLTLDAFMADQTAATRETRFVPEAFRVPLAEIERLTSLDFGPALRAAQDPVAVSASPGEVLAALAPRLDAEQAPVRTATVQRFLDAARDARTAALSPADQRTAVAGLVAATRPESLASWSATGRFNLLYLLSEIPGSLWRQPGWEELAGQLRENLAALERRIASGETRAGADTRRLLAATLSRLDQTPRALQRLTVYAHVGDANDAAIAREAMTTVGAPFSLAGVEVIPAWRGRTRTGEVRYYRAEHLEEAQALAARLDQATSALAGRRVAFREVDISRAYPNLPDGRIEVWFPRLACASLDEATGRWRKPRAGGSFADATAAEACE